MRNEPRENRHLLPRFRDDIGFEIEIAEDRPVVTRATAQGDARKLRGIPVLAPGVGGGMRGSLPHVEACKDRQ
jgi:hypothetical protein